MLSKSVFTTHMCTYTHPCTHAHHTHTHTHTRTHTRTHTHVHTHTYTHYSHDIPVFRIPSESPNPKETKNTRGKLSTLLKKIRNRHRKTDNPMEVINNVNLFTYFTLRPAVKLPMALPNAHTATPNPTYLTPIH